jgi:uncharacterized integral membrane protein
MRNFLRFIVVAPIAILLLVFAFANRHIVAVSFDPFASGDNSAFALAAPLFLLLLLTLMVGVAIGGAATWFSQGRFRRAARQNRAEADRWRSEAEASKARAETNSPPSLTRRA